MRKKNCGRAKQKKIGPNLFSYKMTLDVYSWSCKEKKKPRVIYRLQYSMKHAIRVLLLSCIGGEYRSKFWMNRSIWEKLKFHFVLLRNKRKKPVKIGAWTEDGKKILNEDRRVILLWINPNFCHGKKECEGFSGRILLAVGFVFFRRNSLDEKWCHERRLWAQRSPAILLGWWSVNGPCSCPPFVTWEFHYNLKRNRKNSD